MTVTAITGKVVVMVKDAALTRAATMVAGPTAPITAATIVPAMAVDTAAIIVAVSLKTGASLKRPAMRYHPGLGTTKHGGGARWTTGRTETMALTEARVHATISALMRG